MLKRLIVVLIIGALMISGAVFAWYSFKAQKNNAPGTILPSGGTSMKVLLPKAATHFRQRDPKWGKETIGGSSETIRAVGCTLCSVAMAVSDLGHPITPSELNANMIANNGYTEQGWMIWGAVTPATDNFAEVVVRSKPDHKTLDECLKRGEIPIVKFYLPGGIPHWVAVIGKDGHEYLIKDPAVKNPKPVKLSSRAKWIHSLRYVRKR